MPADDRRGRADLGVIAKNTSMRVNNTAPALPFIKVIDKSSHSFTIRVVCMTWTRTADFDPSNS